MNNQRGEIFIGIMVIMMGVMMLFGGMHMLHGEHRSDGDRAKIEHEHRRNEGMQHVHDNVDEQTADPVKVEDKE
jgi:hypothetical protein